MKRNYAALILLLPLLLVLPFTTFGLTIEEELKYGKEMYREIARAVPVNNDVYMSFYLRTVTDRLEAVTDLQFPITFTIIDSPTIDAFASVGGYVFITTGLIALCDTEDELAGVLAHEFAHISRRHVSKSVEKQKYMNWTTLATMAAAALIPSAAGKGALLVGGMAGAQQMAITFTRENEEEADALGAINANKAGYGGLGTAAFLKKLRATSDNRQVPRYLLTHPYHSERIIVIESNWRESRVTVDGSFFPFLVARAQILHSSPAVGGDEIWLNRYRRDSADPVNAYAAALIYSMKGDADTSLRIIRGINSPHRDLFVGEMLVNERKFKEAAETLKNERDPIGRFYLAKAYEGEGDLSTAITTYKGIYGYADKYPELYNRVGMLSGQIGKEAEGYESLGKYYLETGNAEMAKTSLERAVNKYGINSKQGKDVMQLIDASWPKKKKP